MKVGKPVSNLTAGLKKFGDDVKKEVKDLGKEIKKNGWSPKGVGKDVKDLGHDLANIGSESIGVAELVGLRYPVSSYESKVTDQLTRGSRIDDAAAYGKLKDQGFKGIVDLTLEGTNDAKYAKAAGLNALNVKILDNSAPTQAQMKQFLDFATDPKNQPTYVHCEAGKGRTGVAVACYRMAVNHFTPEQAIAEGKKLGLVLPNQIEFVQQFGKDLAAGKIAGYPK